MIDFLVGATAALLVLLGLLIIVGPELPRQARALAALYHHLRERSPLEGPALREPAPRTTHPTTVRALAAANQAASLLRRGGQDDLAARLSYAARRLSLDEAAGLRSILSMWRRLERVRVGDEATQAALDRTLQELHRAVSDRAEQLELLPFRG